jgi:fructose-1,6-bisphosphatase/inositol monophosphatase family enzyme
LIPHSLVVGEEAVSKEPSVLDRLQSDNWCWILDPVDGTYEFKNGSPKFRMMAALARNGVPYLGWILAPNIEHKDADSQTVLCAAKGRGAWLNEFEQGCKIVLPPENLADADIKGILASADSAKSGPALPLGARTTRGVGAEFDLLLRDPPGTVDWISFDRCHITPWDFAAPYVLVSEAGGIWCQDDSTPYTPNRNNEVRFIAARSERIFNRVQAAFFPEWDPH